jgi:predicted porin
MNKTLKLAVAAALLAGVSSANAGIKIPAGDWTLDIGGIVNAYYTHTSTDGGGDSVANITTGLLPNYLVVSGSTRQNDLDVGFTISINPGASTKQSGVQGSHQENRQAFLTFGDASWGSVKIGKDLGIYASDAILNDQTLLGVGWGAGILAGNTTTLGRIGRGFMYADWKSQIAYTSPNFNGLSFTVGMTQAWGLKNAKDGDTAANTTGDAARGGSQTAYEAKASYAWTGDIAGKVWVSGISQNMEAQDDTATAIDIGTSLSAGNFGLVGYYNSGEGIGITTQFSDGAYAGNKAVDSEDWYVQASYTIPAGTKLATSFGESTLEAAGGDLVQDMWTVGAYHPITKHLNLVAEYSVAKDDNDATNVDSTSKTVSLGAIMFF